MQKKGYIYVVEDDVTSVLFICTGNIFRSMAAEYALKAILPPGAPYVVASAGIHALPQAIHPLIVERLRAKGADPSNHVQRKLTQQILDEAHIPVAMGLDHRAFIQGAFQRDVRLFNEICFQRTEPILDIHEAVPDWTVNVEAARDYAVSVIDRIWQAMPAFLASLSNCRP